MDRAKKAWAVCGYSFRTWAVNPRFYVLALLLVLFLRAETAPLLRFASDVNVPVAPWIFPFLTTSPYCLMFVMLGIILLFCDAPFLNESQPFLLIRCGRGPWLAGQVLYIALASAIYFLFIAAVSILLVTPRLAFDGTWGKVLNTLAQTDAGRAYKMWLQVPYSVLTAFSPAQGVALSFFLQWLTGLFLGLLIFQINLVSNRIVGSVAAGFLALFTIFVINGSGYLLYYLSPVNWASISHLDFDGTTPFPSFAYAAAILGFCCVLLAAGSHFCMKRRVIEILPPV